MSLACFISHTESRLLRMSSIAMSGQRVFGQSWRISFLAVEGLRDVELSDRDSHFFVVRCGYNHV